MRNDLAHSSLSIHGKAFRFLMLIRGSSKSQKKRSTNTKTLCPRDTERRGEFLIILQVDVVDAHFAGLNAIHYLFQGTDL
jgi:hypothetical protein